MSDAGLKSLIKLDALRELKLKYTKVTDAGIVELQKALPDCKITR